VQPTRSLIEDGRSYRAAGVWLDELVPRRFEAMAARQPDALAVTDGEVHLSFAELLDRTRRYADQLRQAGVEPGDVVSAQLPMWWETVAVAHAVLQIGAVLNPIMPSYRQRELTFIIEQARPRAVIVPERYRGVDHAALIRELDVPVPALFTVRSDPTPDLTLQAAGSRAPGSADRGPTTPDDVALLLYTSGTTAAPKGVLHTHNTLLAEAAGIVAAHELTSADALLFTMPFAHIGGILYTVLAPVLAGNASVLMDVWDPDRALALIEQERVTVQPGMPVFLRGLLASPAFTPERVRSLRLFPMGGSTVSPRDVEDAAQRLGCIAKRTYGSTEMPTLCTGQPGDTAAQYAQTDGRPIGRSEVRVVDFDGTPQPVGEPGEVICHGPELFVGYVDESLNDGAFTEDGWFRTGDVGVIDDGGCLSIVGRLKDIIIRGGENISPKLIEEVLLDHPAVEGVGVVGYPDPVFGERVCAFVQTSDPGFDLPTMTTFLARRGLASFQLPERLVVRAQLPYTLTGKLDKPALRRAAAEGIGA